MAIFYHDKFFKMPNYLSVFFRSYAISDDFYHGYHTISDDFNQWHHV